MNTQKKKNKNRPNKPQNPLPPQNVEVENQDVHKVDNSSASVVDTPEFQVKAEERVPEILSDVVAVSMSDSKEGEDNDSPKKPKRNRGKKKKGENNELTEAMERKTSVAELAEDLKVSGEKEDDRKQQDASTTVVAPTSRKKKGKNKGNENIEKVLELKGKSPIPEPKNDTVIEVKEEKTSISVLQEQEGKPTKKKNKKNKKNRNDSENTEAVSCSVSSQNITPKNNETEFKIENIMKVVKDMEKPLDKSIDSENTEAVFCSVSSQNITPKNNETELKIENIMKVVKNMEKPLDKSIDIRVLDTETKDEGSKGKKKNKKCKKNPPEEEVSDKKLTPTLLFNTSQDVKPINLVELLEEKDKVIDNREKESTTVIASTDVMENVTIPIVKESSPKPKAKIAKPVEKKGKDKKIQQYIAKQEEVEVGIILPKEKDPEIQPAPMNEEGNDDLIMCPITDDSPEDIFVEETKKKDKDNSRIDMPAKDDFPKVTMVKDIEKVNELPSEVLDNKDIAKRDILEKIVKSDESTRTFTEEVPKNNQKKVKKGKAIEMSLSSISNSSQLTESPSTENSNEKSVLPTGPSKVEVSELIQESEKYTHSKKGLTAIPMPYFATEIPMDLKKLGKLDPALPIEEANISTEGASSLVNDDITTPEQETSKKRKKSPKPPKKPSTDQRDQSKETAKVNEENIDLKSIEPFETALISGENIAKSDVNKNKIITESVELEQSEKLEMTHTQTSTNMSTDITPDMIESPRSTSADVIDSNNNMMIHEINTPSTLTVAFVKPETPIICSATESPEMIPPDEKILDVTNVSKPAETVEKTDVKSKMIEVNQDMEDLRLSIEKSLAELTALERKDEEFGIKPYETKSIDVKKETPHPLTPIQEMEIQLKLPSDLVRKQQYAEEILIKVDEPNKSTKEVIKPEESKITELPNLSSVDTVTSPASPSRKDNKGKNKAKKKDKQENQSISGSDNTETIPTQTKDCGKETKKEEKSEQKDSNQSQEKKGKQQSNSIEQDSKNTENITPVENAEMLFDPIENFEDAMTSSADDVNKSFEIIANEAIVIAEQKPNPEINITEPDDVEKDKEKDSKQDKVNPIVSQPKNLLGHPVIPVRSSKMDYKKEKNKTPNLKHAKVKIKDSNQVKKIKKESKESQTENKPKLINNKGLNESVTCVTSGNDEYVYKYSFRKVFLPSNCHVCKKDLKESRVACNFCNLLFYCSKKHKDEDTPQHQAFCFAVSTICHLKGQKHILTATRGVSGHEYRLLRMQLIVSCEKILKRRLSPSEQEALLYPRVCADGGCREWRVDKLMDCDGCGQISYCTETLEHIPKAHSRWCKSYALYRKLVVHQLTQGRLEPPLPTRTLAVDRICDNINRLLADMYHERIDMTDIQYAALTQLATAPLTAAYSYQLYNEKMRSVQANGVRKSSTFTIHVVGAELQFEADSLHKWEVFFLHLRPEVMELRVTLVGPELNPSNLPLDLLGNVKLCPTCRVDRRRMVFQFQDKLMYHQYRDGGDFLHPDLVCAFNPSIHRSASYNHSAWCPNLNAIFKLKSPFCITAYSMSELQRDLTYVKDNSQVDFHTVSESKFNPFASVRPDRNFITDNEIPLLFKNYCYCVLIGAL